MMGYAAFLSFFVPIGNLTIKLTLLPLLPKKILLGRHPWDQRDETAGDGSR